VTLRNAAQRGIDAQHRRISGSGRGARLPAVFEDDVLELAVAAALPMRTHCQSPGKDARRPT
jgi:hypothetical protein